MPPQKNLSELKVPDLGAPKEMWKETERFRSQAHKLVSDISKNAKKIYNQFDGDHSANSYEDRFRKLATMGGRVCEQYILDAVSYQRPWENREGTYLIQLKTKGIEHSATVFGDPHPNGCVPLVLVPKRSFGKLHCTVPEGVWAIVSKWGRLHDVWEAGLHFMSPGTSVKFVVTKSHVPFFGVVKSCPTLDCVFVKIDVLIVFYVVDPMKFVLNLGSYKLTDLLSAFLEESIRSLARSVFYDQVYDLRGRSMDSMIRSLQGKLLEPFGIDVDDITITNIQIPHELQDSMQNETSYISKHRCKQKNHEYDISVLLNKEQRHFADLGNENERKALDEESKRFRLLLSKECDEIESLTQKRLAEIRAEQESETLKFRLQNEKDVAEFDGRKNKLMTEKITAAKKRAAVVDSQAKAYVETIKAQTELTLSEYRAQALKILSDAESKSYEDLRTLRRFLIAQKQLEVLEELSQNEDLVVSASSDYSPWAQLAQHMNSNSMIQRKALRETAPDQKKIPPRK